MPMKVEVFTSEPSCSGGRLVLKLIEEIKKEYGDKIEVEVYKGPCEKAKEYNLKVSPAIVIDKDIRIIGVCPTKATLVDALREAGLT
jgi:predicted DsbA family dithiol-disulfide isomerase